MYPKLYDTQSMFSPPHLIQSRKIQRLSRVTQLVNYGIWTRTPGVCPFSFTMVLPEKYPKCCLYGSEQQSLAISRDKMKFKISDVLGLPWWSSG